LWTISQITGKQGTFSRSTLLSDAKAWFSQKSRTTWCESPDRQNFNVTKFPVSGHPGSVIIFHEDESEMSLTDHVSYCAFNIISFYLIKSLLLSDSV
jgi:hypothetical protein